MPMSIMYPLNFHLKKSIAFEPDESFSFLKPLSCASSLLAFVSSQD